MLWVPLAISLPYESSTPKFGDNFGRYLLRMLLLLSFIGLVFMQNRETQNAPMKIIPIKIHFICILEKEIKKLYIMLFSLCWMVKKIKPQL